MMDYALLFLDCHATDVARNDRGV